MADLYHHYTDLYASSDPGPEPPFVWADNLEWPREYTLEPREYTLEPREYTLDLTHDPSYVVDLTDSDNGGSELTDEEDMRRTVDQVMKEVFGDEYGPEPERKPERKQPAQSECEQSEREQPEREPVMARVKMPRRNSKPCTKPQGCAFKGCNVITRSIYGRCEVHRRHFHIPTEKFPTEKFYYSGK